MQPLNPSARSSRALRRAQHQGAVVERIALDEHELAARWDLSVKTLRRWRMEQIGPIFCKLGARVTYLITDVKAFERRNRRYGTGARVPS